MANLQYTIEIKAPVEKVWNTMLDDEPYRIWTGASFPGSYYDGDWSEGSVMYFVADNPETGKRGGMVSKVKENRPQQFISLEHYAELHDEVEHPWPESGFENYTFTESDGGTNLTVDMLNVPDEYASMFDESWPGSLLKLKELAEA